MNNPYGYPPPATGMSKTTVAVLFLCTGLAIGFVAGIGATKAGSAFLEDFASSEAPANVSQARSYERPGFSFKYPGNWKVESEEPENDPDHRVNVESPGSCMTMLFVFDMPLPPADQLDAQVNAFVPKLIASPERTPFTTWGKYSGEGMALKGKILGISPGQVRIFAYANDSRSFVAVEQCYDEDMAHVKPGLDLVESSFQLNSVEGSSSAP